MGRPLLRTLLLGLVLLASPVGAVTISLSSPAFPIQSGATVSVEIVASGAASDEFVSAFDLGLTFDPAQFNFVEGSFAVGRALGTVADADFLDFTDFSGTDVGTLLPYVVSLLDDQTLAALQTDVSTILARFDLRALTTATERTAAIGLTCNSVAGPLNDEGIASLLEISACNGTTAVIQPVGVHEPDALALLGLGLLALGWVRRLRPVC